MTRGKTFNMKDAVRIEEMLSRGKKVVIEWHTPYEHGNKVEQVKYVRWDGLIFTTGECVYTGIDKIVSIREV